MNAQPTMEAAPRHVQIRLDHSPVAVTLGTHLTMMDYPAMVRTLAFICIYTYFWHHSLLDVDECTAGTDSCQHSCVNTVGSYTCTCNSGYSLNNDGQSCSGIYLTSVLNKGCYYYLYILSF